MLARGASLRRGRFRGELAGWSPCRALRTNVMFISRSLSPHYRPSGKAGVIRYPKRTSLPLLRSFVESTRLLPFFVGLRQSTRPCP